MPLPVRPIAERRDQTVRPGASFLLSTLFVGLSAAGDSIVGFDSKDIATHSGAVTETNGNQVLAVSWRGDPASAVPVADPSHHHVDAGADGTSDSIASDTDAGADKATAHLPGAPAAEPDDQTDAAATEFPLSTPFFHSVGSGDPIVEIDFKGTATSAILERPTIPTIFRRSFCTAIRRLKSRSSIRANINPLPLRAARPKRSPSPLPNSPVNRADLAAPRPPGSSLPAPISSSPSPRGA